MSLLLTAEFDDLLMVARIYTFPSSVPCHRFLVSLLFAKKSLPRLRTLWDLNQVGAKKFPSRLPMDGQTPF